MIDGTRTGAQSLQKVSRKQNSVLLGYSQAGERFVDAGPDGREKQRAGQGVDNLLDLTSC